MRYKSTCPVCGKLTYMANLDKTIKALQYHLESELCCSCVEDAVNLLIEYKESQEQQKIKTISINGNGRNGRCPHCINLLNENYYPNYCGFCGKAVKWESD